MWSALLKLAADMMNIVWRVIFKTHVAPMHAAKLHAKYVNVTIPATACDRQAVPGCAAPKLKGHLHMYHN
jgi:hypothetical protein